MRHAAVPRGGADRIRAPVGESAGVKVLERVMGGPRAVRGQVNNS